MKNIVCKVFFAIFLFSNLIAQNLPQTPINEINNLNLESTSEQKHAPISFPMTTMVSIRIPVDYDAFVIGEHTQTLTAPRYIKSFKINKFETTYQLWYEIRILAEKRGYVFQNPGQEGSGGRRGKLPTEENKNHPVTTINWRDAIIWCNALSEIQGLKPVYTFQGQVLRNSTDSAKCDLAEADFTSTGYRLPTEAEWEYAARKKLDGTYQRGDFPSGVLTMEQNVQFGGKDVAWFDENTNGTQKVATNIKSNALGLFDMSGNILEFCWDWEASYNNVSEGEFSAGSKYGYARVARGGSWSPYASFILSGDRYSYDPDEAYNYLGFRFVQTEELKKEIK
ncbi:MAG: formylglycine-generating enzyme family protein [Treponemataceae bacterium]